MTTYAVKRQIRAEPEKIWDLLTDAERYPSWNPAVLGIEGSIALGERIKLTSVVDPERVFKLRVSELDRPTMMVWSDGMPFGLFKGVRTSASHHSRTAPLSSPWRRSSRGHSSP